MNYPMSKLNALSRYLMVHTLSGQFPLYIVNEYPKSGGSWIGQMLGSALELPFPRNRFPVLRSSIMHGHYFRQGGMKNSLVVWRDGRDMMVSWYHHCLFQHERYNARQVGMFRKNLAFADYDDVEANLPDFLEYAFTRQPYPRFSWAEFVERWHNRSGVCYTKYEHMRMDTAGELRRIVRDLSGRDLDMDRAEEIAEAFSFARQSGREPGEENKNSFMRKGIVGDWRNSFSREACEVFDYYAGDVLILLGYESDHSWVNAGAKQQAAH